MSLLLNSIIVGLIIFLVILSQIILPSVGIFFLGQWLIFILIFALNFFQKGSLPLSFAFLAGALLDFISGLHFGVFTLSLISIALVSQIAQQRLQSSSLASFFLALAICGAGFFGLTRLFFYVFNTI